VPDVALTIRIYLLERTGWEIFVAVFRGALPGRVPWFESGACNRTDDAVAEIPFSCSDNARSCFMISAFCDLLAFLGRSANTFTITAHITSAVATPINGMLIIYAAFLGINGQIRRS
jgi:hypothetical protein